MKAKQRVSLADIIVMGIFSYGLFFSLFFVLGNTLSVCWQLWTTLGLSFVTQGLLIFSHPGTT